MASSGELRCSAPALGSPRGVGVRCSQRSGLWFLQGALTRTCMSVAHGSLTPSHWTDPTGPISIGEAQRGHTRQSVRNRPRSDASQILSNRICPIDAGQMWSPIVPPQAAPFYVDQEGGALATPVQESVRTSKEASMASASAPAPAFVSASSAGVPSRQPSSAVASPLCHRSSFFGNGSSCLSRRARAQRQHHANGSGRGARVAAPARLRVQSVLKESQDLEMGTRAPDFSLPEPLTGKQWSLADFEGHPALLVVFICNHCPYVIHLREALIKISKEYIDKEGLGVVAISSNSIVTHPQDGPELMAKDAKELGFPFPYLYDETQEVAKAYKAACTPDFYIFKKDGRRPFELAYHGQFDDSRPKSGKPATGKDLRIALDCILSGRPIPGQQKPSIGCNIKWTPGQEPDYF